MVLLPSLEGATVSLGVVWLVGTSEKRLSHENDMKNAMSNSARKLTTFMFRNVFDFILLF